MAEDDNVGAELARLRGLGVWMRDVGAVELELGDVRIKLAPNPPAAPGRAQSAVVDPDERAALRDEEKAERAEISEEEAHKRYWRRIVRSSGAPIPPFRPQKGAPTQ